jgi:hypothetical protein
MTAATVAGVTGEAAGAYGTAALARRWGRPSWQVRRQLELAEAAGVFVGGRVAHYRALTEAQLQAVEAWLRQRG